MNRWNYLILTLLLWSVSSGMAQSVAYSQIDVASGLSNNFVLSMALDGDGNVWAGTEAGLNRISGQTVSIYRRKQLEIENDKVFSLFYDHIGNRMLIGTEMGLVFYDCRQGRFGHRVEGDKLENYSLVDMADDHHQGVWLIFGNGIIQHLDLVTNKLTTLPTKLPGSRCGMDDGQGHLYIGHSKEGMSIVGLKEPYAVRHYWGVDSGNAGEEQSQPGKLPSNNVRRIAKDSKGRIWIGTDQGLAQFDSVTEWFELVRSSAGGEHHRANVFDIKEMADGHLWTANDIGGVVTDEGRLVETSSMNTRFILQDIYHNVWIGNHSTGIDFIPNHKPLFRSLSAANRQTAAKRVYGITNDRQGRLWVSGEDELCVYGCQDDTAGGLTLEGHWRVGGMKHRAHSFARCLMADSKGHIWLGMEDEGVILFDTRRKIFEPIDIGYDVCDIHSFMEDTDGRIWIGAEYGVCTYENGRVVHQDIITHLAGGAPVTSFIRLATNQLLLTTQGSGLCLVDTETMTAQHLTMADGLPSNNINHALPDRKCGLWLATSEGVMRLPDTHNLRKFTLYGTQAGLEDRQVRAIRQDEHGRIWASTFSGIVCLNPATGHFYKYGQQQKANTGGFMEGAAATLRDGAIAFGSVQDVYYFQPADTETRWEVSPVRIVRCEVFSPTEEESSPIYVQPDEDGRLRLTAQQNTLCLAYAVSDYAQTNDVEYIYMMKGLSNKWYTSGDNHEVVFRSLHPGNYTFVLRAKLRNQDWEKATMTQLSIRIAPPFWHSWWAYLIYFTLTIATILLLIKQYKHRIALHNSLEMTRRESLQKQELNEERLRFFTNITHELRTPLTLILGPLEDLVADNSLTPGSRRKVEMINRNAGRLRDLINQILEFRKVETQNRKLTVARGDIGQFVKEIVLNYKELNRNPRVEINHHLRGYLPRVYFDSEVVATILNNLLSNAVKYTEQGSIDITVEAKNDREVMISVADTGYGITPEALPHIFDRYYQANGNHQASGTGIGLSLVKSLADLHEAQVALESEEGKGCRFTVKLSAVNNYPNALHKEDDESDETAIKSDVLDDVEDDEESTEAQPPLLLVVEDNEDIRQYIADSLYDDFRIIQANNGMEGMALVSEHLPDLIISDIMMPKMNGIQLTRQIKSNIQTCHIPVILLTAKNADEDKEEGYDSGADSYLTKPFTAKLLTSRIRNLLANRRRLAEQLSNNGIESIHLDTATQSGTLSRLDREFIERLNRTIEEHIMQTDIDMAFLTDKMAMSHSTFYRKVKALTGLTANAYVRKQRLRHCYRLLESGNYNVTEAAMMTGFSQMAHFREVFKKEFGMLPSELSKGSGHKNL